MPTVNYNLTYAATDIADSDDAGAHNYTNTDGYYVDDSDISHLCSFRFSGINITGASAVTSAILTLVRATSAWGNSGTNGTVSIRCEASAAPAALNAGTNPKVRTYRTAEVIYTFAADTVTVNINVTSIIEDLRATYGAGITEIHLAIGAQQMGWQSAAVSWRIITGRDTPPALAITYTAGGPAVYTLTATTATVAISAASQTLTYTSRKATYVSAGALAYSTSGGTTVAPAYPASLAAGDLIILRVGQKPSTANGGTVTTPSGFTLSNSIVGAGGYGTTLGADTGNTNIFEYYKTATGSETGTLSVTVGTNNVCWAQMYRVTKSVSGGWLVQSVTGSDVTNGTAVSVAFASDPGIKAGDLCLVGFCIPTDVTTPSQFSAEALTAAGVTFGTMVEISEPDTTVGNQIGGVNCAFPVTAGASTGIPTFTATAGGTTTNVRGPGILTRIRVPQAYTLTANPSSVAVAVQPANLNYATPGRYSLICSPSTVALTAQTQGLKANRRLNADPSSVAISTLPQSLTWSGAASSTLVKYSVTSFTADPWPHGSIGVVRDTVGSAHDFVFLAWNGSEMTLYKSTNYMGSSSTVTKSGSNSITWQGQGAIAQDSAGNLHLLYSDGYNAKWVKITLTRTAGSVTAFSIGTPINIPGNYDASDWRFAIYQCYTTSNVECMIGMSIYGSTGAHQQILFRCGINPTATTDFKKLTDGTAGYDVVFSHATEVSHSFHGHFAQVGSTKNILCAFGPINVGHGGTSTDRCSYRILTANGENWTIGTLVPLSTPTYVYQCYGTSTDAWVMWQDGISGVRFDKYSASGTYTANAVSSPDSRAASNGVGVFSVSSAGRIHTSYLLYTDAMMNPLGVYWAFWNGSQWQVTSDFTQGDYQGMFGSVGWDNGLAAIYVPDPVSQNYIGSIRSVIVYSVQAQSANVSVNTSPQTLRKSCILGATPTTITTTGQPVGLLTNKKLNAQSQSVAVTTQSAGLRASHILGANSYALGLTAQSQMLLKSRLLTVSSAPFAVTPQSQTLRKTNVLGANSANVGVVAQTQTIRKSRVLTANSGYITVISQTVTLSYAALGHYTLNATPVAFGVTAQNATLLAHRRLGATAASIVTTGQQVTLTHTTAGHYSLIATPTSIALLVQSVGLRANRRLGATGGSVALTAQPAGVRANRRLAANSAAINAAAQVVGLTWAPSGSHVLTAQPASIGVATQSVLLRKSNRLYATASSVAVSPATVGLYLGHTLTAVPTSVVTTAQAQFLAHNSRLIANSTSITTVWSTVQINYSGTVRAEPWTIDLVSGGQGLEITVIYSGPIAEFQVIS
jgi:hypothetical protein